MKKGPKGNNGELQTDSKLIPIGTPVADLFRLHRDNIIILQSQVQEDIIAAGDVLTPTDHLFLLRFLLSSRGNIEKAAANVRTCLEYRKQNLELLQHIKEHGQCPYEDEFKRFQVNAWLDGASDDCPLLIIRAAFMDMKAMFNTIPPEKIKTRMLNLSEIGFQRSDALTRKTKLLYKVVNVVDLNNFSPMKRFDMRMPAIRGEVSHINAAVYPQLVGRLAMVNAPFSARQLFKIAKKFMSKQALEKQGFCPVAGTDKRSDIDKCPFVSRINAQDRLPDFLGGPLECPALLKVQELEKVHIPGSKSQQVEAKGLSDQWSVSYEVLVRSSGKLVVQFLLDGRSVADEVTLTSKDGLLKGSIDLSQAGTFTLVLKNSNWTSKNAEVLLEVHERE